MSMISKPPAVPANNPSPRNARSFKVRLVEPHSEVDKAFLSHLFFVGKVRGCAHSLLTGSRSTWCEYAARHAQCSYSLAQQETSTNAEYN